MHFQANVVVAPDLDAIRSAGLDALASSWCVWHYQSRNGGGKPAKVPFSATGARLRVDQPETWLTFDDAAAAFEAGGFDGVGLLLSSAPGVVGLDLDGCLDAEGEVIPEKSEIVSAFIALDGYIEISPSGTGLRQFLKGCRLEDFGSRGRRGSGLEVYDSDDLRYLTLTGRTYPIGSEPKPARMNQPALEAFISRWCDSHKPQWGHRVRLAWVWSRARASPLRCATSKRC